MKTAALYAIRADNGLIKFGVAGNVKKRLAWLNSASPCALELLARTELIERKEAFAIEWMTHRALQRFWVRGEWFQPCPKVLSVVAIMRDKSLSEFSAVVTGWSSNEIVSHLVRARAMR